VEVLLKLVTHTEASKLDKIQLKNKRTM